MYTERVQFLKKKKKNLVNSTLNKTKLGKKEVNNIFTTKITCFKIFEVNNNKFQIYQINRLFISNIQGSFGVRIEFEMR